MRKLKQPSFWKMYNSKSEFTAMKYPAFLFFLLISFCSYSQATDIGLWSGVGVEKKINKSFSVNLNAQTRFTDNISIMRVFLGELGVSYKITKHWEISGYYRYIGRRKKTDDKTGYYYRPYHRFYADLAYDHKLWKLKFDYRLRYQNQFKDDTSTDGLEPNKSYLRNKFGLSFPNKSRFTPYVSTDVFYQLGGTGFDQMRNKAGVEIAINKRNKLDISGFTDYQLQGSQDNRFLLGVNYKVKF